MSSNLKTVLVLGAGLVSRPLVRYLLDRPGFRVTVATRTVRKAEALLEGHERGRAVALDVRDLAAMEALVAEHDLTVSLLPAPKHPEVARACLKHGRHMATTSYISPAMAALDDEVRKAGLLFINECGVDPGIDHMSAMRIFHDVEKRGGRVVSFKSYCGGLPAPDANDNPLGYKFSWAPRGVLVAARNSGRYKWENQLKEVPGAQLLTDVHLLEVAGAGIFEAYANRDSMPYQKLYGLGELETLFRGTLRYPGHCARWKAWGDLGLFEQEPVAMAQRTRAGLMRALLGVAPETDLPAEVARRLGTTLDADAVVNLGWLGMYEEIPLADDVDAPVDALAEAMLSRMTYKNGERDMIVMHHEVVSDFGGRRERTTMDLVDYGIPHGDSSMARTVSLPVAIAVRLLLEGAFSQRGVVAPVTPEMYVPILRELEDMDIVCAERTEVL